MPFNALGDPIEDFEENDLEDDDEERFEDEDGAYESPPDYKAARQTTNFCKEYHKSHNTSGQKTLEDVLEIIKLMRSKLLNTTLFLEHLLWGTQELIENDVCRKERTALTHSEELKGILLKLYRPPRKHNKGIKTRGAGKVMSEVAVDIVSREVNREMRALRPVLEASPSYFTEEKLLATSLVSLVKDVKSAAPTLWSLCRSAAFTPQQAARNTRKTNPDPAILTSISILAFSRSVRRCKLQQLVTFYVDLNGAKSRVLDTLHALGLTLSQKTAYTAVNNVAKDAQRQMREDVKAYPVRGSHDNINIRFQAFEQRSDNKSHFDSGTAATVYPVKDPEAVPPSAAAYHAQRAAGAQDPITPFHIYKLDSDASPRIYAQETHQILRYLLESEPFDLPTYEHRGDDAFHALPPVNQLPTGPEHRLSQWMCGTIHQEEASYEGNERCLREWLRQFGLDGPDELPRMSQHELIVWMGDQLTCARMRGLKKLRSQDFNSSQRFDWLVEQPGWFHTVMNLGFSFHRQYYGKAGTMGLKHAADLLERRYVATPSVQGNFHQHWDELLKHAAEAHFRDAWCTMGGVSSLDKLRSQTPQELVELADKIWTELASTEALSKLRDRADGAADDYFEQAVMFNRDILTYINLDSAIKNGDVGRVRDLLPRILFRFMGGSNGNYIAEMLELIQALECEWPEDLKAWILKYCWLGNTTGRPGCFAAFDLIQEHNIRDIKHIFAVFGPYVTWEYIKKISTAIPTMRKVKDHVEEDINRFRRGKAHTKPAKEKDVAKLQEAYAKSKIHVFTPSRPRLANDARPADYIQKGSSPTLLRSKMDRWSARRMVTRSTAQDWTDYIALAAAQLTDAPQDCELAVPEGSDKEMSDIEGDEAEQLAHRVSSPPPPESDSELEYE